MSDLLPFPLTSHSIARQFGQVVQRHPDRVALETASGQFTYRQLDQAANRIAQAVLDHRGEGEEPIAVLMDRDLPSIASILGLVKAGKAYVPLEPAFPVRRLAELVGDCRPGLLLAGQRHADVARAASTGTCGVLDIGALDGNADDPGLPLSSDTLAYIIYTSGSTGRPKGVAHSHFGLLHQVMRHSHALDITADDRITMLGSSGAAQANTQLWLTLLNGATLFPRDLRQEGLGSLAAWLSHHRITCFRSSASVFRHWAAHLPAHACPTLRLIAIGGEVVYRHDVLLYRARFRADCRLVNALSSTEVGTVCMHVLDHDTPLDFDIVPVGRPVVDLDVLLVDESGAELPAGKVGEIMVRSRGLALGYWTRDGLDPTDFPSDARDSRLRSFRMGDLGRWIPGGALLQLGRRDTVVKVSGHRIDPVEIECVLRESNQVAQVAVIGVDGGEGATQLVACIVPASAAPPDRAALRRFLEERLPAHMLPSQLEFLARLPHTASGKIDRQALQALAAASPPRALVSGGRLSLLGVQLGGIWEDILGITGIGPDDDFMDLGGGSLLAMDMLLRIERVCGRRLLPSRLLGGPLTIARLVDLLMSDEHANFSEPLVAVQAGGVQRPLFFLHGDHENGGLYCYGLARHLGADQPFYALTPHGLDGDALPWSIAEMARERLDAIRTIQSRGPYWLGGFCTGGLIAFEMARQLEAQGEEVDALLLIDTALDNAPLAFRVAGRSMRLLARVFHWDEEARRRRFLRAREALTHYRASVESGRWGRTRYVIAKVRSRLVRRAPSALADVCATTDTSAYDAHLARHDAYGLRRRDYLPGRIAAPIALFRSKYLDGQPAAAGWSGFTPRVEERVLSASHQEVLTRHIEAVANWMKPYLGAPGR